MAVTRVGIYTRISTDEENQPTSLDSQRERLEAFCKAQEGWRMVSHQEDRATGTKLDRPGLQAALDLARDGRIDLLLVYRVDRLSRKVRQLAQLAEELDTYGVDAALVDRAVRHRLGGRADDVADAGRVRRVRARHHRRPRLRRHRTSSQGGPLVRRPPAVRVPLLRRAAHARPRPGQGAGSCAASSTSTPASGSARS
jgi:hypothetical protein